jgi:GT2 family glycosyltransferase
LELSVIIVNYKVYHYLVSCIQSVQAALNGIEGEIIVVDNESDSVESTRIIGQLPSIKFIANSDNKGFSKANNQALAISKGSFVLFLNPDTVLPQHALKDSLSYLSQHQSVGAVGVQMINKEGQFLPESKRAFPKPMTAFFKLSGLAHLFPRSGFYNQYALGNLDKDKVHPVEILAGAYLMVRTQLVKQIGGFDEQFFMYGEDIDLSKRLTALGFQNHYLGNIVIQHIKGASTNKNSKDYLYHFYHSMHLFVNKYYALKGHWLKRKLLHLAIRGSKSIALLKYR